MLNTVEGGKIDAAFSYRNMAVQRHLPYVSLPDTMNFSDPVHADVYGTVSYDLGETTVRGVPIRYAATALTPVGEPWIDDLVTAMESLQQMGFTVPSDYPRRRTKLALTA
jgi:molybdate/tungstate transport system substrate-binding protein